MPLWPWASEMQIKRTNLVPSYRLVLIDIDCHSLSRDCREGQIHVCSGLNANEIQIPYDKHHKVSLLVKSHQNTHNSVKYEVI